MQIKKKSNLKGNFLISDKAIPVTKNRRWVSKNRNLEFQKCTP